MDKTVYIKDIVDNTVQHTEGNKLFTILDQYLSKDEHIRLSLKDSTPLSSSFLNTSFGQIIKKYGIDFFKKHITISEYTINQAIYLKSYVNRFSSLLK
jgi:hypothetical protein